MKKNKVSNNLTEKEINYIQLLYKEGKSTKEIAITLKRGERTVRRYRPKT